MKIAKRSIAVIMAITVALALAIPVLAFAVGGQGQGQGQGQTTQVPAQETAASVQGCLGYTDSDGNGVCDNQGVCAANCSADTNGDGICDNRGSGNGGGKGLGCCGGTSSR
jgi:hypothetical protein